MGKKFGPISPVGKVNTGRKSAPGKVTKNKGLDKLTVGSAMGILNKHFMGSGKK